MDIQKTGDLMVQTTERINQLAQSGNELLSTFERIMSIRRDCEVMAQKTEQVRMITQERIVNTLAKFKQNQDIIEKVFGERDKALSKYYEILDKALESNDRQMLLASMEQISKVVTTSPLAEIERISQIYDDTNQPLLDF